MSLERLKLSKPLLSAMTAAGYLIPKEVQLKTLSRIYGGQDVIAVGPEGCGKTTTLVLATLMRIKYGFEEAPRALILVPDKERLLEILERFQQLNHNSTIRIIGLHTDDPIDQQVNEVTDGVDIIVAIPSRARAIYLKLGLNTNKIQLFVVDDADEIVKAGMQLPVSELANSVQKCQHLVFSQVMHERLSKMIEPFMKMPVLIEVDEASATQLETHTQLGYHVPNFRTKLNLLNLLLSDSEVFDKVVVFVNTRLTAQTLLRDLFDGKSDDVFVLKPLFFDDPGFNSIAEFEDEPSARILIIANENFDPESLSHISSVFHFELPEQNEVYVNRILKNNPDEERLGILFATDLELASVKKIEQITGQKIDWIELPENLLVERIGKTAKKKRSVVSFEEQSSVDDVAFHQKKDQNAKTSNFGMGQKIKMNKNKKYK